MPKNIVILCDGTSNEISGDRTNILRLYGTLVKDETQLVYYDPGVGTFGAEHSASRYYRKAVEIRGLATGWGLDHNVKEAYQFLVQNYDDGRREDTDDLEPDKLYLFGFSRGAYTARVLAGLIHAVGIIRPENVNLIDYAYRAYKNIDIDEQVEHSSLKEDIFKEVRMFERILSPRKPSIRCLGLFDTVGSVIEWTRRGPRFKSHAHSAYNPSVRSIRHALAIDERRSMFQPQLWPADQTYRENASDEKYDQPQDIKEVWFMGVHADIGGGYPEKESGLAKISLEWMIDETSEFGLKYDRETVDSIVLGKNNDDDYVAPNALAAKHDSLSLGWKFAELLPRRVRRNNPTNRPSILGWYWSLAKPRMIPTDAHIHDSVDQGLSGGY